MDGRTDRKTDPRARRRAWVMRPADWVVLHSPGTRGALTKLSRSGSGEGLGESGPLRTSAENPPLSLAFPPSRTHTHKTRTPTHRPKPQSLPPSFSHAHTSPETTVASSLLLARPHIARNHSRSVCCWGAEVGGARTTAVESLPSPFKPAPAVALRTTALQARPRGSPRARSPCAARGVQWVSESVSVGVRVVLFPRPSRCLS